MDIRKQERLEIFLKRLSMALPADTAEEALALVAKVLNGVEDEFTSSAFDPDNWENDGRMYPPLADSAHEVAGRPDLTRYRSRGHNTWIGANGAIFIATLDGEPLLDKAGKDEKKVTLS